jgi:hypothetical protein
MTNDEDYNPKARKEKRLQKSKDKSMNKDFKLESFNEQKFTKQELKKKKQEIEEDEWEDWERYYNR